MLRYRKTELTPEEELELELLVRRHRTILYNVCRNIFPDDIYHMNALYNDIICNLWKSMGQVRKKGSEEAWVRQIAANTAVSFERDEKKALTTIPFTQEMVENLVEKENNLLLDELYELVEQLDPKEKIVMEMYLDHIPQAEIARRLAMTETNVSTMIGRIKKKLIYLKDNK